MTKKPGKTPADADETIRQLRDLVERVKRGEVSALKVLYRPPAGRSARSSQAKKKPGTGPG